MARTPSKTAQPEQPLSHSIPTVRRVKDVSIPKRGFKAIRPLDQEFDNAVKEIDRMIEEGEKPVVEIFLPRRFLETVSRNPLSRQAAANQDARTRDNRMRDQVARWWANYRTRHPERKDYKLTAGMAPPVRRQRVRHRRGLRLHHTHRSW